MVEARKASTYSVVLILVVSIPVASQQVDIDDNSEGFKAFIDTNFSSSFQMDVGSGIEEIGMEDSQSSYSRSEEPEKEITKLVTPQGSLKVEKTPNMSVETMRTPYGVLKTGFVDGENISSFSGPEDMRNRVKKIKNRLKDNLSMKGREANMRKTVVMDRLLPDVSIGHRFGDSERILLENKGSESISLEGWKVKNSDPDIYELEKTIAPGEEIVLYPGGAVNVTGNIVEEAGVDIDKTEDTLTLENRFGRKVDTETW